MKLGIGYDAASEMYINERHNIYEFKDPYVKSAWEQLCDDSVNNKYPSKYAFGVKEVNYNEIGGTSYCAIDLYKNRFNEPFIPFVIKYLYTRKCKEEGERSFLWPYLSVAFSLKDLMTTKGFYNSVFAFKPSLSQQDVMKVLGEKPEDFQEILYRSVKIPTSIDEKYKEIIIKSFIALIKSSDPKSKYQKERNGNVLIKLDDTSYEEYENIIKQLYLLIPESYRYKVGFTISPTCDEYGSRDYSPNKCFNIMAVDKNLKNYDNLGWDIVHNNSSLTEDEKKEYDWLYKWADMPDEDRNAICTLYNKDIASATDMQNLFSIIKLAISVYEKIKSVLTNEEIKQLLGIIKNISDIESMALQLRNAYFRQRNQKQASIESKHQELELFKGYMDAIERMTHLNLPLGIEVTETESDGIRPVDDNILEYLNVLGLKEFLKLRYEYDKSSNIGRFFKSKKFSRIVDESYTEQQRVKISEYRNQKEKPFSELIEKLENQLDIGKNNYNDKWEDLIKSRKEFIQKLYELLKSHPDLFKEITAIRRIKIPEELENKLNTPNNDSVIPGPTLNASDGSPSVTASNSETPDDGPKLT